METNSLESSIDINQEAPSNVFNYDTPIDSVKIHITGLKKIAPESLDIELAPLKKATSVKELFDSITKAEQALKELQIFETIQLNVASPSVANVDLYIFIEEKSSRYSAETFINQCGQISLGLMHETYGVLGSKRIFTACVEGNNWNTTTYKLDLNCHAEENHEFSTLLELYRSKIDNEHSSSMLEKYSGILAKTRHKSTGISFATDICFRSFQPLLGPTAFASDSVLNSAVESFKWSFAVSQHLDKLPGPIFESNGMCRNFKLELGLPMGNAQFLKCETNALLSKKLTQNLGACLSIGFGHLLTLSSKESHILDRFHMHGNFGCGRTIRGFSWRGLGPADKAYRRNGNATKAVYDHIGANSFLSSELTLAHVLPFLSSQSTGKARLFASLNFCSLLENVKGNIFTNLVKQARCSIGCGILMPIQNKAWVELCCAFPLLKASTDSTSMFEIGFRITKGGQ